MLSYFWKTAVGDSESESGWKSAGSTVDDERELDDDAAAERMLTQFPAYGTNARSSFDDDDDDDEYDGGYEDTMGQVNRPSPRGGGGGQVSAAGGGSAPPLQQHPRRHRTRSAGDSGGRGGGGLPPGDHSSRNQRDGYVSSPREGRSGRPASPPNGGRKTRHADAPVATKKGGEVSLPWDTDEMDLWHASTDTGVSGGTEDGDGADLASPGRSDVLPDGVSARPDGSPRESRWRGGEGRRRRRRRKRMDWSKAAVAATVEERDRSFYDNDSDDEASSFSSFDGDHGEWGYDDSPRQAHSRPKRRDHVPSAPPSPGARHRKGLDASSSDLDTSEDIVSPDQRKTLSLDSAGRVALLRRRRMGARRGAVEAATDRATISAPSATSSSDGPPQSGDVSSGSEVEDERDSAIKGSGSESASGTDSDRYGGRQHWMPDQLCRNCYSCEAPFTVWRRRHHCRICGQVFCSTCSSFFVEVPAAGEVAALSGTSAEQAAANTVNGDLKSSNGDDLPQLATNGPDATGSGESDPATSLTDAARSAIGSGGTRTMRACKMCFEQISARGLLTSGGATGGAGDAAVRPAGRASGGIVRGALKRGNATDTKSANDETETERSSAEPPQKGNTGSGFLPSAAAIAGAQNPNDASEGIAGSLAGYDGPDDLRELSLMKKKADEERKRRDEEEMIRVASEAAVAAAAAIGSDSAPSKAAAAVSSAVSPEGAQYKAFSHSGPDGPKRKPGTQGQFTEGRTRFARKISGRLGKRFGRKISSRSIDTEDVKAAAKENNDKELEAVSESGNQSEEKSKANTYTPSSPTPTVSAASVSKVLTVDVSNNVHHGNSSKSKHSAASSAAGPAPSESRRLGLAAANHLERIGRDHLETDAPLLLEEAGGEVNTKKWVNVLMTLATRCCATVRPDVKRGDLLDIRPYCKIKVIPGGSVDDCAYMSGIIFRKTVSHKSMAKEIDNPRIMLLSGGIEYTRTENRIASLDILLEQEEKYLEILVTKIIKLKPDVLMVGRSVSRKAQELLLRADVVLLQHVKSTLMGRIARQTGATILSSTDHVMNQFGSSVLGKCRRFRLATFRDNETWFNDSPRHQEERTSKPPQSISVLLADTDLPHHKRQAVLAASSLGEEVIDGAKAVKSGLAKRGVTLTYAMVEGCPKHLGCTVVLRGASRSALKQVKRVFRFLVNVAYNLRLETSYLRERCAKLPTGYEVPSTPVWSSSLCVDYGSPPHGRKVRPWNGGNNNDSSQRSISGKITAFDHQSILITSVWMTGKNQCCPAEVKGICYYSMQDVSLGQFLRDSCFNLSLKCQNQSCKKSVLDHSLSFIHNDGLINITVEQMDDPLPPAPLDKKSKNKKSTGDGESSGAKQEDNPIATWSYCVNCAKVVTRLVYISEDTWNLSFGKFLEIFFYNRTARLNSPEHGCECQMQTASTLYFGCGRLAARFTYERIRPYGVHIRRALPFDDAFHRTDALKVLELISVESSELFIRFNKHIEKISRDARQLFASAANKPEHLQTVLSELNSIGSEVGHAAKAVHEKFASVTSKYHANALQTGNGSTEEVEALLRFPWHSRRYLFMLMGAWNERLSAAGQTLSAMKKRGSRGDNEVGTGAVTDGGTDEVMDGMKRLRQLREANSRFNIADMSMSYTGRQMVDAQGIDDSEYHDMQDEFLDYDEEFNMDGNGMLSQPDDEVEFSDGADADVLASRRRLQQQSESTLSRKRSGGSRSSSNPKKSLGTRRQLESFDEGYHRRGKSPAPRYQRQISNPYDSADTRDSLKNTSQHSKSRAVTAGGAVKSALNRFFNRGSKENDPFVVDLGIIGLGRLRIDPGISGMVVPIFDEQPSTIIAHSLASDDYDIQFKAYSKAEGGGAPEGTNEEVDRSIEDYFTGRGGLDGPNKSSREGSRHSVKKAASSASFSTPTSPAEERKEMERRMLVRNKSHIKHTFRDFDEKGQQICKFVCTTYWATQFHAVRQAFLSHQTGRESSGADVSALRGNSTATRDVEKGYIQSLSAADAWAASGGKSGASFSRTADDRFVIKCISRTELQMFLDCAPAYFEYLSKAFFHGLPTVLCKIVGVYQIGYHNRVTGRKTMEQVAVMQNIFHGRKISRIFDLKGSLRGRFTQQNIDKSQTESSSQEPSSRSANKSKRSGRSKSDDGSSESDSTDDDDSNDGRETQSSSSSEHSADDDPTSSLDVNKSKQGSQGANGADVTSKNDGKEPSIITLLDGDFLEFTGGRPLPLNDRAKAVFHMSILNDTLFLSIINVLDYSILVGVDEERMELVVGIIDFMRQYDILKQMERVGKSLPMVVGSEAPTIIQPPLYKQRFTNAMERYFMTVPSKWTTI